MRPTTQVPPKYRLVPHAGRKGDCTANHLKQRRIERVDIYAVATIQRGLTQMRYESIGKVCKTRVRNVIQRKIERPKNGEWVRPVVDLPKNAP
jgi:hypothetical protein